MDGTNILSKVKQEIMASKTDDNCPEQDYENCDTCGNKDCNPEPFDVR